MDKHSLRLFCDISPAAWQHWIPIKCKLLTVPVRNLQAVIIGKIFFFSGVMIVKQVKKNLALRFGSVNLFHLLNHIYSMETD